MLERELFGSRTLDQGSFLGCDELRGVRGRAAECAAAASAAVADASTAVARAAEFRALAVRRAKAFWLRDE
jgi:hypothetical protein